MAFCLLKWRLVKIEGALLSLGADPSSDLPVGQITQKSVQTLGGKYSSWRPTQITAISTASCPTQRGVGHVTDAGRDAVDADARLTGDAEADGEVVWF